jgi:uncharacterized repeat protein (TIGR02543 family)
MFADRTVLFRGLPLVVAALAFLFAPAAWTQTASCTAGNPNPSLLQTTPTADFDTTATDGTVIHAKTGLMWKRCAEGQTWNASDCTGIAIFFDWLGALAWAANSTFAGYTDWRLPNVKELQSIVETCGYGPTINQTIFPATPVSRFWSASGYGPVPAGAWLVFFFDGLVDANGKSYGFPVRLVRGGQSFDPSDALGYLITVTASPAGGGTVSCAPNPVSSGGSSTCTATANPGYTFADWSGDCMGTACTLSNVTATKTVTANFTLNSYAITTAANPTAGGTVTCTPNPVAHGGSSSCTATATATAGYTFSGWSGDCTGTGACALSNVTGARSVTANFTLNSYPITVTANPAAGGTASCTPNPVPHGDNSSCTATASCTLTNVTNARSVTASFTVGANKIFTGPTATGTGDATATVSGGGDTCGFTRSQFVAVSSVPAAPPAGYGFPHGLFDFALANCAPGGAVTLTIAYPTALPAGAVYWKYGPTPGNASPAWYEMPANIAGNTATFTITDGGLGDDDLTADGAIVDQGGPGAPGTADIPTLSEWAMLLMMGLLLGLSGWRLRRKWSF